MNINEASWSKVLQFTDSKQVSKEAGLFHFFTWAYRNYETFEQLRIHLWFANTEGLMRVSGKLSHLADESWESRKMIRSNLADTAKWRLHETPGYVKPQGLSACSNFQEQIDSLMVRHTFRCIVWWNSMGEFEFANTTLELTGVCMSWNRPEADTCFQDEFPYPLPSQGMIRLLCETSWIALKSASTLLTWETYSWKQPANFTLWLQHERQWTPKNQSDGCCWPKMFTRMVPRPKNICLFELVALNLRGLYATFGRLHLNKGSRFGFHHKSCGSKLLQCAPVMKFMNHKAWFWRFRPPVVCQLAMVSEIA